MSLLLVAARSFDGGAGRDRRERLINHLLAHSFVRLLTNPLPPRSYEKAACTAGGFMTREPVEDTTRWIIIPL